MTLRKSLNMLPHVTDAPSSSPHRHAPWRRRRPLTLLVLAVVALTATLAVFRISLTGRFYGLYLLKTESGRPLEIKDDLKLGDGPRLLAGVSFSGVRELFARRSRTLPRLEVDWDEKEGGGTVTNYLADGQLLQTHFGRYVDSLNLTPRGLFVGGAFPDVAASDAQNQSGMALHDARGWHHLWCNVNEAMMVPGQDPLIEPGEWSFLGSRLLVEAEGRVVIASDHEVAFKTGVLRMERFAYFKAGLPWFRLGINLMNVGDHAVRISYAYGDEPWVGEFGSSAGNYGWNDRGVTTTVGLLDPRASQWGGIVDTKSGLANFIGWAGSPPDLAYFNNHPGTPAPGEVGQPLDSNEVFIGLEWRNRVIEPGETLSLRLTIGLAAADARGFPTFPPGAVTVR